LSEETDSEADKALRRPNTLSALARELAQLLDQGNWRARSNTAFTLQKHSAASVYHNSQLGTSVWPMNLVSTRPLQAGAEDV
jgi:hypothetical protein